MRLTRALCAFLLAVTATQAASIVERHGALKVVGAQVVDQAGVPLQLTGMSMYWDLWSQGSVFFNKGTVDWLVSDWQASVIRVPLGITDSLYAYPNPIYGGYPNDSAAAMRRITPVIDAAISNGVYVIIDWHEYSTPTIPHAKAFFSMMAKKYGDLPNVIFEIWNEPVDVVWSDISDYADSIIPVIRQYSKNLVIVGTPNWSGQTSSAAGAPLNPAVFGSVAYTDHFYTCSNTIAAQGVLAASKKIPVFVTEWGASQSNGGAIDNPGAINNGANDNTTCLTPGQGAATPAQTWYTSLLDPQKISSCNWSLSNADESSAALKSTASDTGNWAATDLTPSGTWVRNNIRAHCTADPSVCPYEGTYAPAQVLAVPGIIPATATTIVGAVSTEPTQEVSGGRNLTSIDSADNVTYSIRAASANILWF